AALENRLVQRTLDASLVRAVDVGEGERSLRYLPERVEVPVKHHVSARERSGLVAAEDVHAAEVLDRLEMFDDHLLARHVRGPAATTSAVAVPLTTDVPRKTTLRASAGCRGAISMSAASFSAGIDSPVSAACWTWRSRASRRRASAGTRSPAASRTMSPGT